jgi:hypothetical protein
MEAMENMQQAKEWHDFSKWMVKVPRSIKIEAAPAGYDGHTGD